MYLQFNVESEPRDTLATTVSHKHSHIVLVVVNPMICKYMLSQPLIAATKVSTVGQYMFKQANHNTLVHVRSPYQVRSVVNVA